MSEQSDRPVHIRDEGALHKYRTEIPNTVVRGIRGSTLSLPARWLYVYLKSIAGDQGECWQNTTSLVRGARLSRGAVSGAKKELAKAGLIVWATKGERYHDTDHIRIVDVWPENMQEFADPSGCGTRGQCAAPDDAQVVHHMNNSCSPHEQPPGSTTHSASTGSRQVVHHMNNEPSQVVHHMNNGCSPHELEEDPKRRRSQEDLSATHAKLDRAFSSGFQRFWQAYPLKKGKGHAWSAWRKLQLEPLAEGICASIQAHQAQDTDWQRGFIKHPTSYLNGRCWEDEFSTPPTRNSTPKRRGLAL